MYLVKSDLLFILVFMTSISCVLTETLQNFSTFCQFSLGRGGRELKRKLRELSFLSDIDILTSSLTTKFAKLVELVDQNKDPV